MYTTINGCHIYYETHGNEHGEAIFFIHGGPGMGDCRTDIKAFSALGNQYKLVFLDMRGSGRSEEVPPYTHKQWVDDIEQLRQYLQIGKIKMLGGSYGGFITLEYALAYPENLTHVILRDTAASNEYNDLSIEKALASELPGINEEMLHRLFGGQVKSDEEFKQMYAAIIPLYTVDFDPEQARQKVESIYYHYKTHNFAFKENQSHYNLKDRLHEIKIPVLVTVGRHDWITPVIASEEIHERLDHSELVIFEDSGHSPYVEESEKYFKHVRDFLEKN